jgi:NAD(P)-dependent dehydrogenase (short-subunit alcohol dehydrogenase family)
MPASSSSSASDPTPGKDPAARTPGRLAGKVAVVTGGGNGIGRACCLRFAGDGAAVVVADLLDGPMNETVELITAAGGRAVAVRVEAASRADNHAMAEAAITTFGRLDVLLTAAGISHGNYQSGDIERDLKMALDRMDKAATPGRNFVEMELEEWQKVIDVNLTGTMLAMQACAERMIAAGNGGAIVTIASIAAKHPDAGPIAYTVSKAGVWMLTKKAARELAAANIRVNAIGPGYIDTNMTRLIDEGPGDRKVALYNAIPMARKGGPFEIASVASFLVSDDASYMTGEILHPDGGYYTE